MRYKPVRKVVKTGKISISQVQSGSTCSTNVKYLGTGIVIWQQWPYLSYLHTCAPSCTLAKDKNTRALLWSFLLESYPAYGLVWVVTLKGRAGSKWARVTCRFFSSQSLLTLKSLKAAFPMKNNFYLVLSTCIVAQTNRQIAMWVHALIIYPSWRDINHEQMQQKQKINSGCIMLCIFIMTLYR